MKVGKKDAHWLLTGRFCLGGFSRMNAGAQKISSVVPTQ